MSWLQKLRRDDPSHRVLHVILGLTVVIFALFFLIGYHHPYAEDPDFIEPELTSALLVFMLAILALAVGVTLWAVVSSKRKRGTTQKTVNRVPVALISTAVSLGTLVIMVVAFLLGSTSVMSVNGQEYSQPVWLRATDMFVISALILMVLATTLVAVATIWSHFKRR